MKSSTNNAVWASEVFTQGELENAWSEYAVELITNKSQNYAISGNTTSFTSHMSNLESLLVDYGTSTLIEREAVVTQEPIYDYSNTSPLNFQSSNTNTNAWSLPPARPSHVSLDGKHFYKRAWSGYTFDLPSTIEHWYTDIPYSSNSLHYTYMGSISVPNRITDIHVSHDGNYAYLATANAAAIGANNRITQIYSYELTTPFHITTATNEHVRSIQTASTLLTYQTGNSRSSITMSADGKKTVIFHNMTGNTSHTNNSTIILKSEIPFDISEENTTITLNQSTGTADSSGGRGLGHHLTGNPDCSQIVFGLSDTHSLADNIYLYIYSSPSYDTLSYANATLVYALPSQVTSYSGVGISQNGEKLYIYVANSSLTRISVANTKGSHAIAYAVDTPTPANIVGVYDKNDIKVRTAFVDELNEFKLSNNYTYSSILSGNTVTLPFNNNVANIVHLGDSISFTRQTVTTNSVFVTNPTSTSTNSAIGMIIGSDDLLYAAKRSPTNDQTIIRSRGGFDDGTYFNFNSTFTFGFGGDTVVSPLHYILTKEAGVYYSRYGSNYLYISDTLDANTNIFIANTSMDPFCLNEVGTTLIAFRSDLSIAKHNMITPFSNVNNTPVQTAIGPFPADTQKIEIGDGGRLLYFGRNDRVDIYSMTNPLDLSTIQYHSNVQIDDIASGDFSVSNDGTKFVFRSSDSKYKVGSITNTSTVSNVVAIANVTLISGTNNHIVSLDKSLISNTYTVKIDIPDVISFTYANNDFISYEKSGDNHLYRTDWNVLDGDKRALKIKIEAGETSVDANSVAINLKRKI